MENNPTMLNEYSNKTVSSDITDHVQNRVIMQKINFFMDIEKSVLSSQTQIVVLIFT